MGRFDGKVALVTGAARGQGAAEARAFATEGAWVLVTDVLDDDGEAVAAELGDAARYRHLDVRDPDEWRAAVGAAVDAFGGLDVLVNNAGVLRPGLVEDMPLEDLDLVIAVNQVGCWLGMRTAAPALRERGGGAIVNTSSTSGIIPTMGIGAYSATKSAIRAMTRVAAMELGPHRIRVNSVHPGGVDTAMAGGPEWATVDRDAVYSALPAGRIGRPEEIAAVVLFLASDDASYCTGTELVVDGGMLAGQVVPTQ